MDGFGRKPHSVNTAEHRRPYRTPCKWKWGQSDEEPNLGPAKKRQDGQGFPHASLFRRYGTLCRRIDDENSYLDRPLVERPVSVVLT